MSCFLFVYELQAVNVVQTNKWVPRTVSLVTDHEIFPSENDICDTMTASPAKDKEAYITAGSDQTGSHLAVG